MDGIVRADQKIRASLGQLVSRREHQVGNPGPIVSVDAFHVSRQRMRMHRDFGMIVGPEQMSAFKSNRAVAECRPLRAARHNADVLGHGTSS